MRWCGKQLKVLCVSVARFKVSDAWGLDHDQLPSGLERSLLEFSLGFTEV